MLNSNVTKIFKLIDNIINNISSFIESKPDTVNEDERNKLEVLFKSANSLLPSLRNEFGVHQQVLNDETIFKIINDGLNEIDANILHIYLSKDEYNLKINKFLDQVNKLYNVRREFKIFYALNYSYSKKLEELEVKLINDNKEKFEVEVVSIKDQLEKLTYEIKRKYDLELNELTLQLNTTIGNNEKTLGRIYQEYEVEFQYIKNAQLEEGRRRVKAFQEFMDELVTIREGLIERFDKSYNKIQTDWKKIQQIKTENVYLNAYHKNTARSKNSENKFIGVTVLSLILSVLTIIAFIFKAIDFSQFISIKIMIVVFFGILIAYYLRISTHYRRLADQAEQTHLELLAFPQYAAELGEEKSREIKEQLALKYFGKEIDSNSYQKISDIAQEQLKTSSELVKAAASISVANTKATESSTSNNPPTSSSQSKKNTG